MARMAVFVDLTSRFEVKKDKDFAPISIFFLNEGLKRGVIATSTRPFIHRTRGDLFSCGELGRVTGVIWPITAPSVWWRIAQNSILSCVSKIS